MILLSSPSFFSKSFSLPIINFLNSFSFIGKEELDREEEGRFNGRRRRVGDSLLSLPEALLHQVLCSSGYLIYMKSL